MPQKLRFSWSSTRSFWVRVTLASSWLFFPAEAFKLSGRLLWTTIFKSPHRWWIWFRSWPCFGDCSDLQSNHVEFKVGSSSILWFQSLGLPDWFSAGFPSVWGGRHCGFLHMFIIVFTVFHGWSNIFITLPWLISVNSAVSYLLWLFKLDVVKMMSGKSDRNKCIEVRLSL